MILPLLTPEHKYSFTTSIDRRIAHAVLFVKPKSFPDITSTIHSRQCHLLSIYGSLITARPLS